MPSEPNTREILEKASRYVVLKSDQGVTVGIHVDGGYGEAHSPVNDLDAAVREAYDRAVASKGRVKKKPP